MKNKEDKVIEEKINNPGYEENLDTQVVLGAIDNDMYYKEINHLSC